jgi:hypothetical protein
MPGPSPFADDWRDCLRAHYMHVIKTGDAAAARTLPDVLRSIGFTQAELHELAVRATLRTDEMPADYVPDVAAVEEAMRAAVGLPAPQAAAVLAQAAAEIAAAQPPDAPPLADALTPEARDALDALFSDDDEEADGGYQQMSLF